MITATTILERDGVLVMYIEGGRSRTGQIGTKAKPGIGRLALQTGAPVVPVVIYGSERVRNWKRLEFPNVTVRYGGRSGSASKLSLRSRGSSGSRTRSWRGSGRCTQSRRCFSADPGRLVRPFRSPRTKTSPKSEKVRRVAAVLAIPAAWRPCSRLLPRGGHARDHRSLWWLPPAPGGPLSPPPPPPPAAPSSAAPASRGRCSSCSGGSRASRAAR